MTRGNLPDKGPNVCAVADKPASLPRGAQLPLNRCNLPAVILGSLTFQAHPAGLVIDGVAELHRALFERLDRSANGADRARWFQDYMTVLFRLEHPEDAGLTGDARLDRSRANYLRLVRGWAFDPDGREAAVLKGWVESRFGLVPRYHRGAIRSLGEPAYLEYQAARAVGLYNTNALEAQLDLLFTYSQYELARRWPDAAHKRLYRGVNNLEEHELLGENGKERLVVLNNLSSFSASRERAGEFGDILIEASVPLAKVFLFTQLLPGLLKGEEEYAVIGGAYRIRLAAF
jgi:NAD+--dinitrogen-reductase ADP-D-ribosyltransferase